MAYVRHAETAAGLNELLSAKAQSLVIINFTAVWSAPGKLLDPIVERFAKSYPQVTFVKVDADKLQDVVKKYKVTNMPALLFIKNREVVDTVYGVDSESIRAAIVQHATGAVASTSGSSEPNDISLLEFIDRSQLNCLNESSTHTLKSIITGYSRNTSDAYLESDTDEQLILNIHFNQAVRVRGISIKTDDASYAPKLIKIAVNSPHIGFEDMQDAIEPQVAQVIELDEETTTSGKTIPLRFVRFQSVQSLHIFVSTNQQGEDETRINSIDIFGLPGQTSRVSELRARDEH